VTSYYRTSDQFQEYKTHEYQSLSVLKPMKTQPAYTNTSKRHILEKLLRNKHKSYWVTKHTHTRNLWTKAGSAFSDSFGIICMSGRYQDLIPDFYTIFLRLLCIYIIQEGTSTRKLFEGNNNVTQSCKFISNRIKL